MSLQASGWGNCASWRLRRGSSQNVVLDRRVTALETAAAERNVADPLLPSECTIAVRAGGEVWGKSSNRPCQVSFARLIQAPQQFEGRWIEVAGRYDKEFETSALFSSDAKPAFLPLEEPFSEALWITTSHVRYEHPDRAVVVGRFHRGPGGHLSQYFGTLVDD
jgi:hypothetical protein